MKNNKGFTLVELLAIIVILAVILVITVPTVFSSIELSRKKSLENSAKGLADWINKTIEIDKINGTNTIDINDLPETYHFYSLNDSYNNDTRLVYAAISNYEEIKKDSSIGSKLNISDYALKDINPMESEHCYIQYYDSDWVFLNVCYSNIAYNEATKKILVVLVVPENSSLYVKSATDDNGLMWAISDGTNSWTHVQEYK